MEIRQKYSPRTIAEALKAITKTNIKILTACKSIGETFDVMGEQYQPKQYYHAMF